MLAVTKVPYGSIRVLWSLIHRPKIVLLWLITKSSRTMSSRKLSGLAGVRMRLLLGSEAAPAGESVNVPSLLIVL